MRLLLWLCVGFGFVSLGCDQDEPRPPAAPVKVAAKVEPCALLTAEEAGAVLEGSATAAPSAKVEFASSCIWEAHAPRRGLVVMTSTPEQIAANTTLRENGGDTLEKRFAQVVESQVAAGGATPVGGLGDAAVWAAGAGQLWVMKKGRALLTVSLHGERAPDGAFEKCSNVARKLVARL